MGLTGFVIIHVFIASFSPAQGERNQMVNAKFTRPVNAMPMSTVKPSFLSAHLLGVEYFDSSFSFLIDFTAVASGLVSVLAREEASCLITAGLSQFESLVELMGFFSRQSATEDCLLFAGGGPALTSSSFEVFLLKGIL